MARWWREAADLASVTRAYGPMIDRSDPTEAFLVLGDGRPVAYMQRYRLDDDPSWMQTIGGALGAVVGEWAGIDYLIGDESMTGRGLGRRMIAAFVEEEWTRYPDISAVVVAVQQANRPSWRALEGAGFVRRWGGMLDSADPSDGGLSYLYVKLRPGPGPTL